MRQSRNSYPRFFIIKAYTLMLRLVHTRVLSGLVWCHLAFFVVSMTMFGLTAGAVCVHVPREPGYRSPLGETTCL
jgi:hypothetical protein